MKIFFLKAIFFIAVVGISMPLQSRAEIYEKNWVVLEQENMQAVEKGMLDPHFWIQHWEEVYGKGSSQHLVSSQQIAAFNQYVVKKGWLVDIRHRGKYLSGKMIANYIYEDIKRLTHYIKYDHNGVRHRDPQFSQDAVRATDVKKLYAKPKIKVRYALLASGANMMALPGQKFFSRHPKEKNFNTLQNTYLPATSEVAVYAVSADKRYAYAQSRHARGWLALKSMAFLTRNQLDNYREQKKHTVISRSATFELLSASPQPSSDKLRRAIRLAARKGYSITLPMGTPVVYAAQSEEGKNAIYLQNDDLYLLPARFAGNNSSQASLASEEPQDPVMVLFRLTAGKVAPPLPLNRAMLLKQFFRQLGTPYAWGGGDGASDCSLLLQQVFASFDLKLPRSSGIQAKTIVDFFGHNSNRHSFKKMSDAPPLRKTTRATGKNSFNTNTRLATLLPASPSSESVDSFKEINYFAAELLYAATPAHIMFFLGEVAGKQYVFHNTWTIDEDKDTVYLLKKAAITPLEIGGGRVEGSLESRVTLRAKITAAPLQ